MPIVKQRLDTPGRAGLNSGEEKQEAMGEEEHFRGQLMAEIRGIREDVKRLEARIEKDSDDLFERVRVLEIDQALQKQNLETTRTTLKRDIAILAAAIGTGVSALVSVAVKLVAG